MHWQSLHPGPPAWNGGARKLPSPSICLLLLHHRSQCTGRSSNTSLLSRRRIAFFVCTFFLPVSPLQTCLGTCEAFSLASTPWIAREHIPDTAVTRVEVHSCSFLPLGPPHPASMSRNHSVLSWSSSCVEALTVEASSVLTAAASGLKLWHLLTPFLPSPPCPPPPSVYPHSETQHTPMGRRPRG